MERRANHEKKNLLYIKDGERWCLCPRYFLWNNSTLNCTKEGDFPWPSEEPSKELSKRKISLTLIAMIPLILVIILASAIVCIYFGRRKTAKRQENRRSDERNRVLRTLDSERHLKDLMDSGEFREEDEKDIDVPFFDLEGILAATYSFSDAKKLRQGGYGLVYKAWRLWAEKNVLDLMDLALHEVCNADQFVKCVNIGLLCVQEDPNDRPTMSNVVTMLDSETTTVPNPKRPALILWTGVSSTATFF